MYSKLEINEQLENAMIAVAKAKVEIGIFKIQKEKNSIKRVDMNSIDELDEILCDVVCRIANLTSSVMSDFTIDEINKEIKNRLDSEIDVSK